MLTGQQPLLLCTILPCHCEGQLVEGKILLAGTEGALFRFGAYKLDLFFGYSNLIKHLIAQYSILLFNLTGMGGNGKNANYELPLNKVPTHPDRFVNSPQLFGALSIPEQLSKEFGQACEYPMICDEMTTSF